jgi:hypothetical protein
VLYADDLVILHQDRSVREHCQPLVSEWLRPLGLPLKPNQTRSPHTLETNDGQPGFDFLGFVRHEGADTAVMSERSGHTLVFCHQYPPKTGGWSNLAVCSSWDHGASSSGTAIKR